MIAIATVLTESSKICYLNYMIIILNNMQVDKYCKIKAVDLNVFCKKRICMLQAKIKFRIIIHLEGRQSKAK